MSRRRARAGLQEASAADEKQEWDKEEGGGADQRRVSTTEQAYIYYRNMIINVVKLKIAYVVEIINLVVT